MPTCSISHKINERSWQRPTLPGPCGPSTIGAGGLNYCVRYGNRCGPSAIVTRNNIYFSFGLILLVCIPCMLFLLDASASESSSYDASALESPSSDASENETQEEMHHENFTFIRCRLSVFPLRLVCSLKTSQWKSFMVKPSTY